MTDISIFSLVLAIASAVGVIGICVEVVSMSRKLNLIHEGIYHLIAMGVMQMENDSIINDNLLNLIEEVDDSIREMIDDEDPENAENAEKISSVDFEYTRPIIEVAPPPKNVYKWAKDLLSSSSK